jgi:hypothetical protein
MDIRKLDETVSVLIRRKQYAQADALLSEARREAVERADPDALDFVVSELAGLCGQMEPPDVARAEEFCLEREAARNTGYNKWQTAMTLYWNVHDCSRTVTKSREAVQKAMEEEDTKTAYSALSLLGLALLELDRTDEAGVTLREIGDMVRQRKRIVVGDETLFLERANTRGLERPTIKSIASILAPVCRDAAFAERLQALALQE